MASHTKHARLGRVYFPGRPGDSPRQLGLLGLTGCCWRVILFPWQKEARGRCGNLGAEQCRNGLAGSLGLAAAIALALGWAVSGCRVRSKVAQLGRVHEIVNEPESQVSSVDYFNPTFVAPQLTPKQYVKDRDLALQKDVQTCIREVYTELKQLGGLTALSVDLVGGGCQAISRNFKSTTGRTFALVDSGLSTPQDLALDGERGALYVADSGAKKIYRYHVYVQDNGGSLGLTTDGVQLCIMQNTDASWVNVDLNGDVFYSDATSKSINRIPVDVIDMLSKGQYAASDLVLLSEKALVTGGGAAPESGSGSHFVYSVYQGSVNPHVSTPAGLVSDGARIYWTNMVDGKTAGSIVEGEVSPKLPTAKAGEPAATAFPSRVLTNETDAGYGVTKSNKYMFYAADKNGVGVVTG
ncbi:unnamed protein product, partial [Symbiodinium pilosum]